MEAVTVRERFHEFSHKLVRKRFLAFFSSLIGGVKYTSRLGKINFLSEPLRSRWHQSAGLLHAIYFPDRKRVPIP